MWVEAFLFLKFLTKKIKSCYKTVKFKNNTLDIIEKYNLTAIDIDRIVEMAWEDRTPFEAIEMQFGLREAEVIRLMQHEMHRKNWQKWRARVQGRATKHQKLRSDEVSRFHCSRQKAISGNKISKR